LLAPGVSNSTRLADDSDYRSSSSAAADFLLRQQRPGQQRDGDGGEANDDEGGVRLTLGQDAVQEFQINRSNYGADMGGASGATINIVSKSGTDDLHGSALASSVTVCWMRAIRSPSVRRWRQTRPFRISTPIRWALRSRIRSAGSSMEAPSAFRHEKQDLPIYFFRRLRQNSQNSVPVLTDSSIFAGPSIAGNTLPGNLPASDPSRRSNK